MEEGEYVKENDENKRGKTNSEKYIENYKQ